MGAFPLRNLSDERNQSGRRPDLAKEKFLILLQHTLGRTSADHLDATLAGAGAYEFARNKAADCDEVIGTCNKQSPKAPPNRAMSDRHVATTIDKRKARQGDSDKETVDEQRAEGMDVRRPKLAHDPKKLNIAF